MEQQPISERLPRLYRAVLDAVADLESRGRRRDAAAIRLEATSTYSKAWTLGAERRLGSLRARAARIAHAHGTHAAASSREALARSVDLERSTA